MNIKIFVGIIVTIVLCGLIIFLKFVVFDNNSSKELKLTYKINAGIPFRWEYEIEDESVVQFVKSYVVKDENKGGIVGAPVYTAYIFRGLKEGETTINFKYVNFTEGEVTGVEKHKVKVDKDKNISLISEE